jgi:hypothetical protein
VNGAEVNETKNMGAGMIPDADSVAEFRLITNSFSAEYGKFTGAVMNTVTKSGTNSFHGTLFEFYRNQKMDAINYFDTTKAELKRNQYGGVFGGPILKDKLFTFTDFQQTRQNAGASTGLVQMSATVSSPMPSWTPPFRVMPGPQRSRLEAAERLTVRAEHASLRPVPLRSITNSVRR